MKKLTIEEFIERANKIHNNKYKYDNVKYIDSHTKVCIVCPEHGEFWQTPNSHLKGCGCCKCKNEKLRKNHSKVLNKIINEFKNVHGDKYDYSKVEYKSYNSPVIIICPKHGEFKQTPHEHLDGCGCQKCACTVSSLENEIYKYVKNTNNDALNNVRNIIPPYELDIYIFHRKKLQ